MSSITDLIYGLLGSLGLSKRLNILQPLKLAWALGNCQGFCQGKSVFSLMCVSKLLPRQNCPNNILILGSIIVKKNLNFYIIFGKIPAIINNKGKKIKENEKSVISG